MNVEEILAEMLNVLKQMLDIMLEAEIDDIDEEEASIGSPGEATGLLYCLDPDIPYWDPEEVREWWLA